MKQILNIIAWIILIYVGYSWYQTHELSQQNIILGIVSIFMLFVVSIPSKPKSRYDDYNPSLASKIANHIDNKIMPHIDHKHKQKLGTKKENTTPLVGGGSNFGTHTLKINNNVYQFKLSIGSYLFSFVFTGMGMLFVYIGFFSDGGIGFIPSFVGLIFTGVGIFIFYQFYSSVATFDIYKNIFYKGSKAQSNPNGTQIWFDDIVSLQIVSELITSRSKEGNVSTYESYELNLVLRDNSRINVVDHGNYKQLQKDALLVSRAINKPLNDYTKN